MPRPPPKKQKVKWSPSTCNEACATILQPIGWLEEKHYVHEGLYAHLKLMKRLTHGASKHATVISDEEFVATLAYVLPVVADLCRVQRLTACRPAELCILRAADSDMSREVWIKSALAFS